MYCERALFVVGNSHAGKSTQLRSMFLDIRFGTDGLIPTDPNIQDIYKISNERCLYIRLTSPHEKFESIDDKKYVKNFLDKTEERIKKSNARRWNFACPLQPEPKDFQNMPDVAKTIEAFHQRFNPERIRVLFLSPDKNGRFLQNDHDKFLQNLKRIKSVEICWIDARAKEANGMLIADFFDFT